MRKLSMLDNEKKHEEHWLYYKRKLKPKDCLLFCSDTNLSQMSGPCIGTTLQKSQCSLSRSARNINPPSEVSAPAFRAILWSCCHVAHLLKDAAPRHARYTSARWRRCENQPGQAEGRARNLVGAFGLKRTVHSRTGQQRSDQFRCRCYHSFGFFSPSFSFPNLLPAVMHSRFHTGRRLSDAEPGRQWCCGTDQVPSICSFSLLNGIILSLSNLRLFGLFLFITAPMTCLSAAPCSSSPDVGPVSPRGFRRSLVRLCKTSVCGGKGLKRVS